MQKTSKINQIAIDKTALFCYNTIMKNNNTNFDKDTKMTFSDFDTTVTNEETQAYRDYVDAEELAAIESEDWAELESDDGHRELYELDFAADEDNYESLDDLIFLENEYDDLRDSDFYTS